MVFSLMQQKKKNTAMECECFIEPVVSICERSEEIVLHAEMPGLEKSNVGIDIEGDELVITGNRTTTVPDHYVALYEERLRANYRRTFSLSSAIDRSAITAQYNQGVLTVTLKKTPEAQPRKIAVM